MSIAITAPNKFDFQDIACVELMLRFARVPGARFLVEPKDGEDGELHFMRDASDWCAEIQVKGASGAISLGTVAACLAHTPPRIEYKTLLERLLSDPQRLAVLVMSGRCDDASVLYTVSADWDGRPHAFGHVGIAETTALLDAFGAAQLPGRVSSKLNAKRRAHNEEFVKTANRSAVQAALSRLLIIERLDEPVLEARCAEWLRRTWRIPGDRLDSTLWQLRTQVKKAKSDQSDAFPLVRNVLESAMPPPVRPLVMLNAVRSPL